MRRLSLATLMGVFVATGLLCSAGLLAAAPAARAAMPPEGAWAWSQPYVPAGGPQAFRAVTAGSGFSFYAAGDSWSSQWVVNRVDCSADSEGFTDWTDTRTGPDGAGASAMFVATDRAKNLYVVGTDQTHDGDIYLVKYSPEGTVLWQKSWDGPAHLSDRPAGLAVTSTGTVLVAGRAGKAAGYDDAVLLRYTAAGRFKWKYITTTAGYDSFEAVAVDANGCAYVTGQIGGNVGVGTMVTVKVDPNGKRVWQRSIAGLGISYSGRFIKLKGSAVYVGGELYKWHVWPVAAKYTPTGKRLYAWTPGGHVSTVDDMTVDAKGRVVLVGTFEASPGAEQITTAWVDMLKADGSELTAAGMYYADYGAVAYPILFNDVAVDSSGNLYLAGEWLTNASGTEGNALVARIPSVDLPGANFQMDTIWRHDGPASGRDQFCGILVQPGNGTFAVGTEHAGDGWKAVAQRVQP
jgi:hypothetical protein